MARSPTRSPSPTALLEAALALAIQLLIARHPDLLLPDDVPRIRPPPSLRAARAIVALGNALLGELARYNELDPDLPSLQRSSSAEADDIAF